MQTSRRRTWAVLSLLLGVLAVCGVADSAAAAPTTRTGSARPAVGIPFYDICKDNPPYPSRPDTGLTGLLTERPENITREFSVQRLYTNGGVGGFGPHTYDLGCSADPSSYARVGSSNFDNTISTAVVGAATVITTATDSVERRARSPQWITSFLGAFAQRAATSLDQRVMVPLLGLGLLAATSALLYYSRQGNPSGVAAGTGWTVVVLLIGAFVLAGPVRLSTMAQSFTNELSTTLTDSGGSGANATTDEMVEAIHYQGWLRRTFGSEDTQVGRKYGPALLEASRISFAEMDAIGDDQDKREALVEKKREAFKTIAAKVKKEDPSAYRYLQGDSAVSSAGPSLLELLFSLFASAFRFMANLLLVTALLLIAVIGLVWLAASPYLVTPAGQGMGRMLLDNVTRAIGYSVAVVVATWLYGIYLATALAPGMNGWWSVILLFLGTIIFWTALRPDRKMLSMLSAGHVDGTGRIMRTLLAAYIGGATAGKVAKVDAPEAPAGPTITTTVTDLPPAAAAPVYVPTAALPATANAAGPAGAPAGLSADGGPGGPVIVPGQVLYTTSSQGVTTPTVAHGVVHGVPAGGAVYQRGAAAGTPADAPDAPVATAPPAGSLGDVQVYRRPGADSKGETP